MVRSTPGQKKNKRFSQYSASIAQAAQKIGNEFNQRTSNQHTPSSHVSSYPGAHASYNRPSTTASYSSSTHTSHQNNHSTNVPSLNNLSLWFDHFDRDKNGALEKEEVVAAIAHTFTSYGRTVDVSSIRESVYALWSEFDPDGNGHIDKQEFMIENGLGESIQAMLEEPAPAKNPSTHYSRPTHQPHSTQPPASETIMRVVVPPGMSPGQVIKIKIPSGDFATVTIPTYSAWKMTESSQSSFEVRVPNKVAPKPAFATIATPTPSTSSYHQNQNQFTNTLSTSPFVKFQSWHGFSGYSHEVHDFNRVQRIPINPSFFIQASGRRKALIIGLNYPGTKASLRGCINDANNMKGLLLQQGYPNDSEHMVVLTDDKQISSKHSYPTGATIIKALQWLVQGVSKGDVLFFHYSGHGSQVPDKTGFEKDGLNETILPADYKKSQIKDDQLWENLVYPLPEGVKLTAVMDCCHSGTGLDLPYEYHLPNGKHTYKSNFLQSNNFMNGRWNADVNCAHSKGDVVLFSGCEDDQTSADVQGKGFLSQYQAGGAMTQSFIQAFQQNPMSTYPEFLANLHNTLKERGFKQRPQLTSSQQFDVNARILSFVEGIEANQNSEIGRIQHQKYPTKKLGGSAIDKLLGISPATAVGILLGAMALDAIF